MLPQILIAVPLIIGVDNELFKLVNSKRFAVGATHTGLGLMNVSIVNFELGVLDDTSEVVLKPPELAVPPLIEVRIVHAHFMFKVTRKVLDGIPADRISLPSRGVEESFHFCGYWPSRVSSLILHG